MYSKILAAVPFVFVLLAAAFIACGNDSSSNSSETPESSSGTVTTSSENNADLIGHDFTAVVEGFDRFGECWFGRTPMDAPDIDGKVFFSSDRPLSIGDYVRIRITDTLDYDLIGEVITDESSK